MADEYIKRTTVRFLESIMLACAGFFAAIVFSVAAWMDIDMGD